jgi:hypothetical protein
LYRRLILEGMVRLHKAGKLQFFGDHADLIDFDALIRPLRRCRDKISGGWKLAFLCEYPVVFSKTTTWTTDLDPLFLRAVCVTHVEREAMKLSETGF